MKLKTMNNIILVILISAGAVFLAMAINEVPVIWSLILPWLRPPYLHVVINGIIIAIAAASRFCRNHPAPPVQPQHLISARTPPPVYYAAYASSPPEVRDVVEAAAVYEREDRVVELKPVMVNGREVSAEDEGEIAFADVNSTYDTSSPEIPPEIFQLEYYPTEIPTGNVAERRMVPMNEAVESSRETISEGPSRAAHEKFRYGEALSPAADRFRYKTRKSKSFKERTIYSDSPPSHSNRNKAPLSRNKSNRRVEAEDVSIDVRLSSTGKSRSPENNSIENIPQRARGQPATAEEYETLESAWKKITEGASREEARPPRVDGLKSKSFKERAAPPSRLSSQKEVSPSQDELNRRVEAFIKKVNEEIRLCRQKSSNDQYIQVNSAA